MVDVLVWGSPFLILISYVARVAGDVYFAESDGSFTAGKKAVGLSRSSLPATPPIGCIDLLARQLWPCHQLALVPVQ